MRALILAVAVLSVLAVLANADAAKAGLSSTPRDASVSVASVDTASPPETSHAARVRTERRAHRPRGIGGPIGAIGGAIGGIFRR
jgi:hypothetical protein